MRLGLVQGVTPLLVAICLGCTAARAADAVKVGAGAYLSAPRSGDRPVPAAPYRTEAMRKVAAQTNQWYSSLLFQAAPEALFALPLSFKTSPAGLEMGLPSKLVVPTERRDVEIQYPHRAALVFSPAGFVPEAAQLARASDWSIDIAMARGPDQMLVTLAHGCPYAYFRLSRGDVRVRAAAAAERFDAGGDARVLGLKVDGVSYAVFGPTGVRWEPVGGGEWVGHLPAGAGYFSAAALPDATPETLQLLLRHAYAFVQETTVDWRYDAAASKVVTTFTALVHPMEGTEQAPLLGLYPHQWWENASVAGRLGPSYETIRGKVRLLAAAGFRTEASYHGFVPFWPGVGDSPRLDELRDLMKTDVGNGRRMMLVEGKGAYWQGKGLQRITQLMAVAEQQGEAEARDKLLALVKSRFESWLSGQSSKTYFHYDRALGTVVGYPEEFFTVEQLNDQHFTYGYWIRAAAEVALRDPAWAAREQWGGMIDLLIADIASTARDSPDFPRLRTFDPYEGHSWASGVGLGAWGNNQEASSEAINAWAGLILWGEIHGNRELRDLGVYLYTTESDSANQYWFDLHHQVFAPEYKNVEASQLFGARYSHNTWWIDEPRQIHGINLLPLTTSSLYLAEDPQFIRRNLAAMAVEGQTFVARGKRPEPVDIWQDIFAQYLALADPAAALAAWDRWGAVEFGDTRTHTLHWLLSLSQMGVPDLGVHADTALYAVFRRGDGQRTYLAYNAGREPLVAHFSDGKSVSVAPGTLARSH
jgi:endoglucanase Acf2